MIDTLSWFCLGINVTCMCYQFYLLYFARTRREFELELAILCPRGVIAERGTYQGKPAVYIRYVTPGEPNENA